MKCILHRLYICKLVVQEFHCWSLHHTSLIQRITFRLKTIEDKTLEKRSCLKKLTKSFGEVPLQDAHGVLHILKLNCTWNMQLNRPHNTSCGFCPKGCVILGVGNILVCELLHSHVLWPHKRLVGVAYEEFLNPLLKWFS